MSGTHESRQELRVGVREFRDHMREYLDRVADGEQLVLTDRGSPIARVSPADSKFWALVEQGHVRLAEARQVGSMRKIPANGTVSDLIERNR